MKKNLGVFLPLFVVNLGAIFVLIDNSRHFNEIALWQFVFALLGFIVIFSFSLFVGFKILKRNNK